jgi:hypothetical protein
VVLAFVGLGGAMAVAQEDRLLGGAGPADPPPDYKNPAAEIAGPSVVEGQKAGIEVGQFAPDFELQPIEPYPILQKWLGSDAPPNLEDNIRLAQLVGKAPIMLLYGSYT